MTEDVNRKDRILNRWANRESGPEISAAENCSRGVVHQTVTRARSFGDPRAARRAPIVIRKEQAPEKSILADRVLDRWFAGASGPVIIAIENCTLVQIASILYKARACGDARAVRRGRDFARAPAPMPQKAKKIGFTEEELTKIKGRKAAGASYQVLADDFNVGRGTIYRLLNKPTPRKARKSVNHEAFEVQSSCLVEA